MKSKNDKIPKIIHYCWFGGNKMPQSAIDCINSWKEFCPDYEIIKWDESNFDVNKYQFTKEAYEQKKWAFVTDVARLDIIYNNGGIYFDTDVELIKNIDDLLENDCFLGFESEKYVNTGLGFGAKKGNHIILENLNKYKNMSFKNISNISEIACPIITSDVLKQNGFKLNSTCQKIDNCVLYPIDYFCPMNYDTGIITLTNNTYSIHHYSSSWKNKKEVNQHKIEIKLNNVFIKIFGKKYGKKISRRLSIITCSLIKFK